MKAYYLILISFGLFLASCSSTRNVKYGDDVYYSSERPAASGDYVTVYNEDERDAYNYREDYEIRRGISNPIYRTSINFGLGMGFGSPFYMGGMYSPFYSPFGGFYSSMYFGSPFYSPFYGGFHSPYAFNSFYSPFYRPFYNPYYYGGGHMMSPYYGYGYGGGYGYPAIVNNGPRVTNLRGYNNAGLRSVNPNPSSGIIRNNAPVRSVNGTRTGVAPNTERKGFLGRLFSNDNSQGDRSSAIERSSSNSRYLNPSTGTQRSNSRYVNPSNTRSNTRTVRPSAPSRSFESRSSSPRSYTPSPAPRVSSPRSSSPRVSSPSRGGIRR